MSIDDARKLVQDMRDRSVSRAQMSVRGNGDGSIAGGGEGGSGDDSLSAMLPDDPGKMSRARELYLRGWPVSRIAAELGLPDQQIAHALTWYREREWVPEISRTVAERKAELIARLRNLESEYWAAYELSVKQTRSSAGESTLHGVEGKDGKKRPDKKISKQSVVELSRAGDPRYLNGALACIDREARISGVDSPFKLALTDIDGNSVPVFNINLGNVQTQVLSVLFESGAVAGGTLPSRGGPDVRPCDIESTAIVQNDDTVVHESGLRRALPSGDEVVDVDFDVEIDSEYGELDDDGDGGGGAEESDDGFIDF